MKHEGCCVDPIIVPRTFAELMESVRKPGLHSPAGLLIEKACRKQLEGYFHKVHEAVIALHLEDILNHANNVEEAKHTAEMRVSNILRTNQVLLGQILVLNIFRAMMHTNKLDVYAEADKKKPNTPIGLPLDQLGLTAQAAADYATVTAAKLVTGINSTTRSMIADAIGKGFTEQLGVPGTGRLIKQILGDATTYRSNLIASTEMNDAMSEAMVRKFERVGTKWKQLIVSHDDLLCDACQSIYDAGPVPVDEPFVDDEGEEYDRTPIHPGCRCATTGARPPQGE